MSYMCLTVFYADWCEASGESQFSPFRISTQTCSVCTRAKLLVCFKQSRLVQRSIVIYLPPASSCFLYFCGHCTNQMFLLHCFFKMPKQSHLGGLALQSVLLID